jgi:hypothetical protein
MGSTSATAAAATAVEEVLSLDEGDASSLDEEWRGWGGGRRSREGDSTVRTTAAGWCLATRLLEAEVAGSIHRLGGIHGAADVFEALSAAFQHVVGRCLFLLSNPR